MKLVLYGETALQWWSHAKALGRPTDLPASSILRDCAPTASGIQYLREFSPFLVEPFHFLVASKKDKRNHPEAVTHVSARRYGPKAFVHVGDGIYASSPELSLMQYSVSRPMLSTVKEGFSLCGSFAVDPARPFGLAERRALTSVSKLKRFARGNECVRGSSAMLKALEHVRDGSASPRETDLAMRLVLPHRLGGFGLSGAVLNRRIDVGRRAKGLASSDYFVADLCWPDCKVVVEYDSNLHLTPEQLARDAAKRRALEADGYLVVTVTNLQLESAIEMERVARRIASRLGKRLRIQAAGFKEAQKALFGLR